MNNLKSLMLVTAIFSLSVFAGSVSAAWQLNFATPPAITNDPTFNLSFTTLSTEASDNIQVTAYQNGVTIGTTTTTKAYGDSGFFSVNLSSSPDGAYEFYLKANNGGGTTTSSTKTVILDTTNPETPNYGGQEQDGNQFTVSFTAANDSDTNRIAVYTSTSPTFTANDSTRVGLVNVTPGEIVNFDYTAPNDQERFFAVQSFDAAGNFSSLEGDENVTVTQGTVTEVTEADGTTTGTTPTADTGDAGAVQGDTTDTDDANAVSSTSTEDGDAADSPEVLGAETEDGDAAGGTSSTDWFLLLAAAAIALLVVFKRDTIANLFSRK